MFRGFNFIKLFFSFQLSIKSESFVDGQFHIQRETSELDTPTMLSKLDLMIAKRKDDIYVSDVSDKIDSIVDQLKVFYTTRSEVNTDIKNQENSVVEEFIEELYSKEAIDFKSTIIKDEIEQKVNDYAQMMLEERSDNTSSDLENKKLLNQYKNELLQEYRDSLENSKENSLSAEQQAIIKVLLDENVKETSSLEALLAAKAGTSKTEDQNKIYSIDDYKVPTLDDEANAILNDLLAGKSDSEKTHIKMWLDFLLMPDNMAHFDNEMTNHTYAKGDSLDEKLAFIADEAKKNTRGSQLFLEMITKLSESYKG
ncbi:MAG: hypothetical protein GQ570_05990 [Helicobacteraceae bacterium]|nr:hypothetical protein [Helicobacteraceae bacterium]